MGVIIFKATEQCNSNCAYCNVVKKGQDAIMDRELLSIVFRRMNEYLTARPEERVVFTWHGGEIGLLGADYFKHALQLQQKYCPLTSSRIRHTVQSNLTLIDQALLDALRAMGVNSIGSSFEPIPYIRGFGPQRDSKEYNRRFFEGVHLLEKNQFGWGVIYVVHKQSLEKPLDIFYYLSNLNFESSPNFNPVFLFREGAQSELNITPEQFAHFLGVIFPAWWKNKSRFSKVRPFADYETSYRDKNARQISNHCGKCANQWVYIGPTGDTSHCGAAGDLYFTSYGNIHDCSIDALLHHPKRNVFHERQSLLAQTVCKDCRFWGVCGGGCPMEAAAVNNNIMQPSPYCETTKIFLEQYFEPISGMRADAKPQEVDSVLETSR
jgi:uncharacterized protein